MVSTQSTTADQPSRTRPRFRGWPLRTLVFASLLVATALALSRSSRPEEIRCVAHLRWERPTGDVSRGSWKADLCWPPVSRPLAEGELEVFLGGEARTPILGVFRERMGTIKVRGAAPPDATVPSIDGLVAAAIAGDRLTSKPRPLPGADGGASDDELIRSFFFARVSDRLGGTMLERIDWPHAMLTMLAGLLSLLVAYCAYRWRRSLRRWREATA